MDDERGGISFTVFDGETEHKINTHTNEYRNLMMLLNDNIYLENFGECGGQGRCATCTVKVSGRQDLLNAGLDRNERSTLDKLGVTEDDIRLSCQILINSSLNDSVIKIVEQV